jgi:hypothetical protein
MDISKRISRKVPSDKDFRMLDFKLSSYVSMRYMGMSLDVNDRGDIRNRKYAPENPALRLGHASF